MSEAKNSCLKYFFIAQTFFILSMLLASVCMQMFLYLEPCILCWLQRVLLFIILLLLCLKMTFKHKPLGYWSFFSLHGCFLAVAILLTWHHIALQQAELASVSCLPNWDILLNYYAWSDIVHQIMHSASCATVSWTWLGRSIPQWLLLAYLFLLILWLVESAVLGYMHLTSDE